VKFACLLAFISTSLGFAQGWGTVEARRPWLQGNFLQAQQKFLQMRAEVGDEDFILVLEAEMEIERAQFGPALALLRYAKDVQRESSTRVWFSRRALLLLSAGSFAEAKTDALKEHPWNGTDIRKLKISLPGSLIVLAEVYLAQGRDADAVPILEKALERAKNSSSYFGLEWSRARNDMAIALLHLGKPQEAFETAIEALAASQRTWGPDSIPAMDLSDTLGSIRLAQQQFTDAENLFTRSRKWRETIYGTRHPKVAASYLHEAQLSAAQGNTSEAIRLASLGLEIERSFAVGAVNGRFALALVTGAEVFSQTGNDNDARDCYQGALPILEKELGAEAPRVQKARKHYQELLQQ
jgi:tetratricopeptide (TPR) repeat protein